MNIKNKKIVFLFLTISLVLLISITLLLVITKIKNNNGEILSSDTSCKLKFETSRTDLVNSNISIVRKYNTNIKLVDLNDSKYKPTVSSANQFLETPLLGYDEFLDEIVANNKVFSSISSIESHNTNGKKTAGYIKKDFLNNLSDSDYGFLIGDLIRQQILVAYIQTSSNVCIQKIEIYQDKIIATLSTESEYYTNKRNLENYQNIIEINKDTGELSVERLVEKRR